MRLAPIALFVYNRPEHLRQTVEALAKNELAEQSELFVFSDGPKSERDAESVEEVRRYLRGLDAGFKNMQVVEQQVNLGLAHSIISGVTGVCRQHGQIIV